jgi:gamma-glutamyl-gamma-aminobutyrate hydrolase PuuD
MKNFTKHIGLTQRVEVVPGYGERRDCLDQRWAGLMISLGFCPVPLSNDVADVPAYLEALALDGVVLTGGNDLVEAAGGESAAPERDRFEHLLLDFCDGRQTPAFGVCRGLQMMNVHYGGSLQRVEGHVNQRHLVELDRGLFHSYPESITVNSYHDFALVESAKSDKLQPVAWAEDGTVEAAVHLSLPHVGVMWHPEREEFLAEHDLMLIRRAFDAEPR